MTVMTLGRRHDATGDRPPLSRSESKLARQATKALGAFATRFELSSDASRRQQDKVLRNMFNQGGYFVVQLAEYDPSHELSRTYISGEEYGPKQISAAAMGFLVDRGLEAPAQAVDTLIAAGVLPQPEALEA